METRSPLAGLIGSRKGVLTLLVIIMATGLEIAIIVLTIRGKLSIEAAILASFGGLFTSAITAIATINGISKEDASEKGRPLTVAAGGNADVSLSSAKGPTTEGRD